MHYANMRPRLVATCGLSLSLSSALLLIQNSSACIRTLRSPGSFCAYPQRVARRSCRCSTSTPPSSTRTRACATSSLPEPGCIAMASSRTKPPLISGLWRSNVPSMMPAAGGRTLRPYSPPLIFGGIQALEGLHMYFDFHSLVQSVIAKFKGPRRIPAWQHALACCTALALLASWLVPWQERHDGLTAVHPSMPLQGSDRTTQATAQPLVAPTSEGGTLPSAPAPQSPEQPHTSATSDEPAEVLDTQALQGLVTRLETARSNSEEHLDTRAMDRLL